jgi:hypothetical protein
LHYNQPISDIIVDPEKWLISANNQSYKLQFTNGNEVFYFFPNPVKSNLQIAVNEGINVKSIRVFDLSGKKIKEISSPVMQQLFFMDVEILQNGIYLIQIDSNNGIATKKFIKL